MVNKHAAPYTEAYKHHPVCLSLRAVFREHIREVMVVIGGSPKSRSGNPWHQ